MVARAKASGQVIGSGTDVMRGVLAATKPVAGMAASSLAAAALVVVGVCCAPIAQYPSPFVGSAHAEELTTLAAPENVDVCKMSRTGKSCLVYWDAVTGADAYQVEYRKKGGKWSRVLYENGSAEHEAGSVDAGSSDIVVKATGTRKVRFYHLEKGKSYQFRVRAMDASDDDGGAAIMMSGKASGAISYKARAAKIYSSKNAARKKLRSSLKKDWKSRSVSLESARLPYYADGMTPSQKEKFITVRRATRRSATDSAFFFSVERYPRAIGRVWYRSGSKVKKITKTTKASGVKAFAYYMGGTSGGDLLMKSLKVSRSRELDGAYIAKAPWNTEAAIVKAKAAVYGKTVYTRASDMVEVTR